MSDSAVRQWQAYLGSFTQVIQSISDQLTFHFLGAEDRPLSDSEARILGVSGAHLAWVRKVAWSYQGDIQVVASAIIPVAETAAFQRLRAWGEQPLGRLLYSDPHLGESESVLLTPESGYAIHRQRVLRFQGHALLSEEQLTPAFLKTWEQEIAAVLRGASHE